jgi:hypothetical protein
MIVLERREPAQIPGTIMGSIPALGNFMGPKLRSIALVVIESNRSFAGSPAARIWGQIGKVMGPVTIIIIIITTICDLRHNFAVWQGYGLNDVCLYECGSPLGQDYARRSKSNEVCSSMRSDHLRSAGAAIACYRVTI